jgi:two-component system, sensor histidine kinase and response regulator
MDALFEPPPGGRFNFGFRQSALWFRFAIAEEKSASAVSGSIRQWILDPGWNLYATFELFVPDPAAPGGWLIHRSGHLLSASGGQERRQFRLPTRLTGPTTCYIRVTGIRALILSPHVTTVDRAIWVNGVKVLGTGLMLGFFLTMALVHLSIYLYTGNGKFKWPVLSNLAFTAFVALTSYQHLIIARNMPAIITMVGLLAQGFLAFVVREFLEVGKHHRKLNAVMLSGIGLVFTMAACSFFLPERLQGSVSMTAAVPVSLSVALVCIASFKRDRVVSTIFLVAWFGAVLSIITYNRAVHGALSFAHPLILWSGFVVEGIAISVLLAYTVQAMVVRRQAAEAAANARSTFLASMSHEIRTPMTAILGFLNLALQLEVEGRLRQYLLKIRTSANHLMGIVNDILDLSKIEAEKVELDARPFETEALMSEVADILVPRAYENGNELVLSIDPMLPRRLIGDPLRLKQILINLGGNAVKFTKNGTVRMAALPLEDGRTPDDSVALRFQVSDTGIGIDPSVLPRLFDTFVQADDSTARNFGGTGLGLNISRRLVHLMGGEIEVRSRLGEGSTFDFTAVFKDLPDDPAGEGPMPQASILKVLVAEDSHGSRAAMEGIAGTLGLRCTFAESGEQAVRMAAERFDLILLDWDLPGMSGPEAAALLRSSGKVVPVVLMTSLARPEVEGFRPEMHGIHSLLAKPFTRSSVQDMLWRVAGQENARAGETGPISDQERLHRERARGLRVLLAEDNESNQELIGLLLSQAGVLVEIAANGAEAVRRLVEGSRPAPDVVLMDVHMPEMDGYEATRIIRSDRRYQDLPIIALTTNVLAGDRERCLAAGMDDHLGKPLDTEQFFLVLSKFVRNDSGRDLAA